MERSTQYRNASQLSHATTKSPSLIENFSMFPSDEEISSFLHASNIYPVSDTERIKGLWRKFREGSNSRNGKIQKETFIKVIKHYFDLPNESIPIQLFRSEIYSGFGARKYIDRGTTEVLDNEIELHDIILALTLISRISDDLKIWSNS